MMRRFTIGKIASARPASSAAFRSFSHTVSRTRGLSIEAPKFVDYVFHSFNRDSGLEKRLLKTRRGEGGVGNVHGEPGRVTFELTIDRRHTNRLNILHGGTIASIVDFGGSLAVASMGLYSTGVSTDLNVSYLGSGGGLGDVVKIEARCDKMGGTLAYTSVTFTNDKGELVARGSHTKFIKLALEAQKNEHGGLYTLSHREQQRFNQREAHEALGNVEAEEDEAEEEDVERQSIEGQSVEGQSVEGQMSTLEALDQGIESGLSKLERLAVKLERLDRLRKETTGE